MITNIGLNLSYNSCKIIFHLCKITGCNSIGAIYNGNLEHWDKQPFPTKIVITVNSWNKSHSLTILNGMLHMNTMEILQKLINMKMLDLCETIVTTFPNNSTLDVQVRLYDSDSFIRSIVYKFTIDRLYDIRWYQTMFQRYSVRGGAVTKNNDSEHQT